MSIIVRRMGFIGGMTWLMKKVPSVLIATMTEPDRGAESPPIVVG